MVDDNKTDIVAPSFAEFLLSKNTNCELPFDVINLQNRFCTARHLGDGKCDLFCYDSTTNYDHGDCLQLCFDNPLSSCTYDLFTNDQCDAECDNLFCVAYIFGSDFKSVSYRQSGNVSKATDHKQCPGWDSIQIQNLNEIGFNESECYLSKYDNPNVNIPPSEILTVLERVYDLENVDWYCNPLWIDDGVCDDLCQTDECLNDENDCNSECVNETCSAIYGYWAFIMDGKEKSAANLTVVCNEWISSSTKLFSLDDTFTKLPKLYNVTNPDGCMAMMQFLDLNGDGYINFREFTSWAGIAIWIDSFNGFVKGINVNCSSCVGVDTYNIDMSAL